MTDTLFKNDWLEQLDDCRFSIDLDVFYPKFLEELQEEIKREKSRLKDGVELHDSRQLLLDADINHPTQYVLEVLLQCAKMETQTILRHNGIDPRPDKVLIMLTKCSDKSRWTQKGKTQGRDPLSASKGLEARNHYKSLRGFVPQ